MEKKIITLNRKYNAGSEQNRNSLGNIISDKRRALNLKQKDISDMLTARGVNIKARAYSTWESGEHVPNAYQFMALCDILGIDDISGEFIGNDYISEYSELTDEARKKVNDYIKDLHGNPAFNINSYKEEEYISLKHYLLPASAGTGHFLDSDYYEDTLYPMADVPKGTNFTIRITGDSMEPNYHNGQSAFVKITKDLKPGDIGIFVLNGDAYIKKYAERIPDDNNLDMYLTSDGSVQKQPVLISLNKKYDPIIVTADMSLTIIGKVLNKRGYTLARS